MGRAEVQPSVNVLMRADPIVHYTIAFTVTGHAIAHIRYRLEGEEGSEQASDPAIHEQDSTPDASRPSNWIDSPKWGFGPMHQG